MSVSQSYLTQCCVNWVRSKNRQAAISIQCHCNFYACLITCLAKFLYNPVDSSSRSITDMILSVCACLVKLYSLNLFRWNKNLILCYSQPFASHPIISLTSAESVQNDKMLAFICLQPFLMYSVGNQRVSFKKRCPSWEPWPAEAASSTESVTLL